MWWFAEKYRSTKDAIRDWVLEHSPFSCLCGSPASDCLFLDGIVVGVILCLVLLFGVVRPLFCS